MTCSHDRPNAEARWELLPSPYSLSTDMQDDQANTLANTLFNFPEQTSFRMNKYKASKMHITQTLSI